MVVRRMKLKELAHLLAGILEVSELVVKVVNKVELRLVCLCGDFCVGFRHGRCFGSIVILWSLHSLPLPLPLSLPIRLYFPTYTLVIHQPRSDIHTFTFHNPPPIKSHLPRHHGS